MEISRRGHLNRDTFKQAKYCGVPRVAFCFVIRNQVCMHTHIHTDSQKKSQKRLGMIARVRLAPSVHPDHKMVALC